MDPIEHGDIPACYVSLPKGKSLNIFRPDPAIVGTSPIQEMLPAVNEKIQTAEDEVEKAVPKIRWCGTFI